MNPSPSGFFNDPQSILGPSPMEMQRYLGKISGPLLDRIDIHIEVEAVPFEKLADRTPAESCGSDVPHPKKERVKRASIFFIV